MQHKFHGLLTHTFRLSHVAYFGAAAMGSHSVYSAAAGVILVCMAVGYVLHVELGG